MKKVAKTPLIVDVLNIQGVQRQLERLADLLGKIQKALGEYLERERASFPRFYFVGDEDLLEIIGNSKSIPKLQKHFKKMFAGVSALVLNEEENLISGLSSKEGEEVTALLCLEEKVLCCGLCVIFGIIRISIGQWFSTPFNFEANNSYRMSIHVRCAIILTMLAISASHPQRFHMQLNNTFSIASSWETCSGKKASTMLNMST